jgi:hypothetical protein
LQQKFFEMPGVGHCQVKIDKQKRQVIPVFNVVLVSPVDPTFTRYDATFLQSGAWPHPIGTVFSVTGHTATIHLPTTEQVSFGDPRYGLAYDPGETAGNSGGAHRWS